MKLFYKKDDTIGVINIDIQGKINNKDKDRNGSYYLVKRMNSETLSHIDFEDVKVYEDEIDTTHKPE